MRLSRFLPIALLGSIPSALAGYIGTDQVSYCSEARAVIVESFSIFYFQANQSVAFSFSLASVESNLNVSANVYVNAYGIQVANVTVDLCDYFAGVVCPLPTVNFTGWGTYPIPSTYISQIPSIAFTVPDIEAYARVELISVTDGSVAACLQTTLSNGLTVKHKGVAIASGVFTLVALLVGLIHTAAVNSPSPAQYRWFDALYLFQTAMATGLLHLNYPLVFMSFTSNFAWAFSLFHSTKMQNSIDSMRDRTGGSLTGMTYDSIDYIDRKLSPYNEYLRGNSVSAADFFKRSTAIPFPTVIQSNVTGIQTGLPVFVNEQNIAPANCLTTIFFFFLAFIGIAFVFHILLWLLAFVWSRGASHRGHDSWAIRLRRMWWEFCGGNALRICLIWFLPLWLFGFYQFKIGDSRLAIFWAVFGILLTGVPLLVVFILEVIRGRQSAATAPGISPLYTSFRWFYSAGVLYRPYRQKFHFFWFAPFVLGMVARSGFIAFGPANAWAQVIGNMVIEAIVFVLLLVCRPHKDRKGDWLAPFLAFLRLVAFGLLIAFIPSVGVDAIPRAIIGFVEIVVIGVPTIILFIGLIWNAGYGWLWRRHVHKIEDGLEVERFAVLDHEQHHPAMQHVDANNFVSAPAATQSRYDGNPEYANSLNRRTSIIEPMGSGAYGGNGYNPRSPSEYNEYNTPATFGRPDSAAPLVLPKEHHESQAAYERAAAGRGGEVDDLSERTRVASTPGTPGAAGRQQLPTPEEERPAQDRRWSRDQYWSGNAGSR